MRELLPGFQVSRQGQNATAMPIVGEIHQLLDVLEIENGSRLSRRVARTIHGDAFADPGRLLGRPAQNAPHRSGWLPAQQRNINDDLLSVTPSNTSDQKDQIIAPESLLLSGDVCRLAESLDYTRIELRK